MPDHYETMPDRYEPPDQYFIRLTPEQEVEFRTWARSNWTAALPADFKRFHPVIRDEWLKCGAEQSSPAWAELTKLAREAIK